jgi:hypothetical protein
MMRFTTTAADSTPTADATRLASGWQRLREHLEAEKRRVMQEIHYYPPPIPACDVQFNTLLAERAQILQELGRLEACIQASRTADDPARLLEEFIQSSPCAPADLAQTSRGATGARHGS